jgi:hypothetical protein
MRSNEGSGQCGDSHSLGRARQQSSQESTEQPQTAIVIQQFPFARTADAICQLTPLFQVRRGPELVSTSRLDSGSRIGAQIASCSLLKTSRSVQGRALRRQPGMPLCAERCRRDSFLPSHP